MIHSFIFIISIVYGSIDIQIRPDILARFPANFSIENSNETVAGFASLDLYKYTNSFTAVGICSGEWFSVNRVLFGNHLRVDFDNEIPEFGWDSVNLATVNIGASIASTFATDMGSFLFNPTSIDSGQIVINPRNSSEFTYDGELFYASNVHPIFWAVPISVRILGGREDEPIVSQPCFIHSNSRYFWIPRVVFNHVRDRISESGMTVQAEASDDGVYGIRFHCSSNQSIIDALPIIQFLLETDNESRINIAQIHPRDYIVDDRNDASIKRVLFKTRPRDSCSLNPIILRNLVVHFDTRNGARVGFGDPLNEF